MDKGKYFAALFVNLTKAFDTVDHALLLQRLKDIRFDSNLIFDENGFIIICLTDSSV